MGRRAKHFTTTERAEAQSQHYTAYNQSPQCAPFVPLNLFLTYFLLLAEILSVQNRTGFGTRARFQSGHCHASHPSATQSYPLPMSHSPKTSVYSRTHFGRRTVSMK